PDQSPILAQTAQASCTTCWTTSLVYCTVPLSSFFFLYWSGELRDLHSFPTRRSSDLSCPFAPGHLFWELRGCFRARTPQRTTTIDRKSTRLNSSHVAISYAVFCLKKKILPIAHHPHLHELCLRQCSVVVGGGSPAYTP